MPFSSPKEERTSLESTEENRLGSGLKHAVQRERTSFCRQFTPSTQVEDGKTLTEDSLQAFDSTTGDGFARQFTMESVVSSGLGDRPFGTDFKRCCTNDTTNTLDTDLWGGDVSFVRQSTMPASFVLVDENGTDDEANHVVQLKNTFLQIERSQPELAKRTHSAPPRVRFR
jgi:hypothetical protein